MKKKDLIQVLTLIVLFLIGIILISGCNKYKSNCVKSTGHWTTFPNSCVDSCEFERKVSTICSQRLTEGCDCGTDKCWNGITCELN